MLNVDLGNVVKFTAKLEQIRTSALPNAIRGTLNDAAFDVKTKTMLSESKSKFINRSPNFFRANSKVEKATGMQVNSMVARVGFIEGSLRGDHNFSVKDLEQQEKSGSIKGKSFIPLDTARQNNSYTSLVKPANRITKITNIIDARKMGQGTKKQQFVKALYVAGQGGYVLGSTVKGETILWRVDFLDPDPDARQWRLTPLYDYRRGRSVHVDETAFMRTASLNSAEKLNKFYIAQAEFWIKRYAK